MSVCLSIFHSRSFPVDGGVPDLQGKESRLGRNLAMDQSQNILDRSVNIL